MAINLSGFTAWTPNASKKALSDIGYAGSNADADQQSYLKSLYNQGEGRYADLYNYQNARRSLDPMYQLKAVDGIDLGSWQPPKEQMAYTGGTLPTSGPVYLPSGGGAGYIGSTPVESAVNGNAPTGSTSNGLLGSAATSTTPTGTNSGMVSQAASTASPITATSWGPQANLQLLQSIGYTGGAVGQGQAGQYLQQLAQAGNYNALSTYEQGRQRLDPTYSLAQENITMPAGVLPNTVQDFNSVQNTALDNLAAGAPKTGASQQLDPLYQSLVQQITGLSNAGTYDPNSATAFMNPYNQQVMNAYGTQASSQFDKLSNQIAARNARNGNAGGSSENNMLGSAATDILNNYNSSVANLLQSGYTQAQNQSQDAFYKNLANKYTAANATTGALGTGQTLDNYLTGQYYNQNNIALGAGNTVQAQNQKQLDAANGTQQADLAYQLQMLDLLRGVLSSYPGGTATSSTTPGNAAQGAIGGGLTGYALSPYISNALSTYGTNQNIANTITNNPSIF